MHKLALNFLFMFFVFGFAQANTVESNENEQESKRRIPIAIVPFINPHEIVQKLGLDNLIRSELINSGRFDVKNPEEITDYPTNFKNLAFLDWQSIDVYYLVIGSVELVDYDYYRIETGLFDVLEEKKIIGTQYLVTGDNISNMMHNFTSAVLELVTSKENSRNSLNCYKITSGSSIKEKTKLASECAVERARVFEQLKRTLNESQQLIAEQQRKKAISEFSKYIPAIRNKVVNEWMVVDVSESFKTTVLVKIDVSGEVKSATVTNSSGSDEFDRSVVLAVLKASPLPIPPNPEFYNYIQEFQFSFSNPSS